MSTQDPIADLLTRIRNGQAANKNIVRVPHSKQKEGIATVLQEEGYVEDSKVVDIGNNKREIEVTLKYYQGKPVINKLRRVSKPSLRVYKGRDEIPEILGGLGITIMSTPAGIMSGNKAKQLGHGGEVFCSVE